MLKLSVITLSEVIKYAVAADPANKYNITDEGAKNIALHVLNFFGFQDRMLDNALSPEDRDVFYMLEDLNLLKNQYQDITLLDGRDWRIFYWVFKEPVIDKWLQKIRADKQIALSKNREAITGDVNESAEDIYAEIPDDIWLRPIAIEG